MALQSIPAQYVSATITASPAVYATVPSGSIYLVRNVHMCNRASTPVTVIVYYDAGFGTILIANQRLLRPGEFEDIWLYLPLITATTISAYASAASSVDLTITGDTKSLS